MRAYAYTGAVLAAAAIGAGCSSEQAEAPGRDPANPTPATGCQDGGRTTSLGAGGCGTTTPRAAADAFAEALRSGSTRRLCALLVGQARRAQECGEEGEDHGPLLRLTIRGRDDIRVVAVRGGTAIAHFPRLGRDEQGRPTPSWRSPQAMTLRRIDGAWRVSHLRLGSDYEPA